MYDLVFLEQINVKKKAGHLLRIEVEDCAVIVDDNDVVDDEEGEYEERVDE
jgi:hypothetical protein